MTLEERIEQEKFKARVDRIKANRRIFHNNDEDKIEAFILRAEEHEQLAELLEELKKRRSEDYGYMADIHQSIGYRKAVDDFVEKISLEISESIIYGMLVDSRKYNGFNDTSDKIVDYVIETSKNAAEQLKAGE